MNVARTRYLHLLMNTHNVNALAAFRHSLTSRIKDELKSVAAVVEPHLWDIDRQLLVFGDPERTSDPKILAAVDAACAALFEAEKEALAR